MVQLAITKALTPTTLVVRITVDPYDTAAATLVSGVVYAADDSVLAAQAVHLVGLEEDYLDTIVDVMTECWRWGAPAQQFAPAVKRVVREARKHRKAHEAK